MSEEPSLIVLHQVLYPDSTQVQDVLPNSIKTLGAQLEVQEDLRGVTQHYLQDNLVYIYTASAVM